MQIIKSSFHIGDAILISLFVLLGFGLLVGSFTIGDFLGYKMYVGSAANFGVAALIIGDC